MPAGEEALVRAAEGGDTLAAFELGMIYVSSDPGKAAHWWKKSAEGGDADAANNLGLLLSDTDREQALHWWRRAAAAGCPDSALHLGRALSDSRPDEAEQWLRLAAGDDDSKVAGAAALGLAARKREQGSSQESLSWARKAVQCPDPDISARGQLLLGLVLEDEHTAKAAHWYESSLERGSGEAVTTAAVRLAIVTIEPEERTRLLGKLAVQAAIAEGERDYQRVGWSHLAMGHLLIQWERYEEAIEILPSPVLVFETLGDKDGELRARSLLLLAYTSADGRDGTRARDELPKVVRLEAELATAAGRNEESAKLYERLAALLAASGGGHDWSTSTGGGRTSALIEAAKAYSRAGNVKKEADAHERLAREYERGGDWPGAASEHATGAELYARCDERLAAARSLVATGAVLGMQGDKVGSLVRFREAIVLLADESASGTDAPDARPLLLEVQSASIDILADLLAPSAGVPGSNEGADTPVSVREQLIDRCHDLIALTESGEGLRVPGVGIDRLRLQACYHLTRALNIREDRHSMKQCIPYAKEAVRLITDSSISNSRVILGQLQLTIGNAYRILRDRPAAEEALSAAFNTAVGLRSDSLVSLAISLLWNILKTTPEKGLEKLNELLRTVQSDGYRRAEAELMVARCRMRQRLLVEPSPADTQETVDEYLDAGRTLEGLAAWQEAADAFYLAGFELAMRGLPDCGARAQAREVLADARRCFEQAGNRHGSGLANLALGMIEKVDEHDSLSEFGESRGEFAAVAFRRRSADHFAEAQQAFQTAGRPVEYAGAVSVRLAAEPDYWRESPEDWLALASEAVGSHETARAAYVSDPDYESKDTGAGWGFRMIARQAARAAGRISPPRWQTLIWDIEQTIKARSLQDQWNGSEIWDDLKTRDPVLREADGRLEAAKLEIDLEMQRPDPEEGRIATARSQERAARVQRRERAQILLDEHDKLIEMVSSPRVRVEEVMGVLGHDERYVGFISAGRLLRTWADARSSGAEEIILPIHTQRGLTDLGYHGYRKLDTIENLVCEAAPLLIGEVPTSTKSIIVCPDRELIAFPWHLLPTLLPDRYRGTIVISPSAGTFAAVRAGDPSFRADGMSYLGLAHDGSGSTLAQLRWPDIEVGRIARDYFPESGEVFGTTSEEPLESHSGRRQILHLSCHATALGVYLGGSWMTAVDLAKANLEAAIIVLSGCRGGAFSRGDDNEFTGIVRQLMIATRAKAAVVSAANVPDPASLVFCELLVSGLTGRNPDRPWPTPDRRLGVGEAVEWARERMRAMTPAQAEELVPDRRFMNDPRGSSWWSPWFVVGDPLAAVNGR